MPRSSGDPCDVSVVCVVRHGHATSAVCLESLYGGSRVPERVIYADIASPPPVRSRIAGLAEAHAGFVHLRFDAFEDDPHSNYGQPVTTTIGCPSIRSRAATC